MNKETLGEKKEFNLSELKLWDGLVGEVIRVGNVKEKLQEFIRDLKDELYVSFIKYYQLHGASKQTMNNIIDKLALEKFGKELILKDDIGSAL